MHDRVNHQGGGDPTPKCEVASRRAASSEPKSLGAHLTTKVPVMLAWNVQW